MKIIASVFNQFAIKKSIISSVAELDTQVVRFLNKKTQLFHFSQKLKIPVKILYNTPETLGLDRIANAVGAVALFPSQNVLSIQAGSCLVFDFVNENSEYLGGSISPGIKLRYEALHHNTKKLPLLRVTDNVPDWIGFDTTASINCGVIKGIRYEIDGFIDDYRARFETLIVLLTGGDADYLQKLIKNTIFAAPNLVMKGLNEIIKYNV